MLAFVGNALKQSVETYHNESVKKRSVVLKIKSECKQEFSRKKKITVPKKSLLSLSVFHLRIQTTSLKMLRAAIRTNTPRLTNSLINKRFARKFHLSLL